MSRGCAALAVVLAAGCASIPPDRYGVGQVHFAGVEAMSQESLGNCLATKERGHLRFQLGLERPGSCGDPPFDVSPPELELWSWSWTEWPLLDRVALERDRERIERWYEARGFHDARVTDISVDPPQAFEEDGLPEDEPEPGCDRRRGDQGCIAEVTFTVEEGEPTTVREVSVAGVEGLSPSLRRRVREAVPLTTGMRFDEALFDRGKDRMVDALGREGHALAVARGVARVDRPAREARVAYQVEPGPRCVFGQVIVEADEGLPTAAIAAATLIRPGAEYDLDDVDDAKRAVLELGSFASVAVEPVPPDEGNVIDIRVTVSAPRDDTFSVGLGVQAGEIQQGFEAVSVPQWDVHLLTRYEHRNLFGGMRRLSLEARPRMIVQEPFPSFDRPRLGLTLRTDFRQPGFLEPRTSLLVNLEYLLGPDPYDTFFRHRFDTGVGLERMFLGRLIYLQGGVRTTLFRVPDGEVQQNGQPPPSDSFFPFLELVARVDLRDDIRQPHAGAMFQLSTHVGGYLIPASWAYVRLLPDVRFYVPLPLGLTFATRFALGMLFVTSSRGDLDPVSEQLGPRDYRLRGGGASSNRGYFPGRLGDGLEGGTRRWEASAELRVPISEVVGLVGFWDMGDVSREERFRFDRLQASTGFGIRFFTFIGSIRFDFAWQVRGLQVLSGEDDRIYDELADGEILEKPGTPDDLGGFVFHLTIGEAF